MKKLYLLSTLILCIILSVNSQVGINIQSPTGMFHIDPKRDSPASTIDDVNVSSTGNIGLGTVTPQAKVHINATSTQTALRLVDGNQKSDRILVSADAAGGVTWGAIKGSGGETFRATVSQNFPTGTQTKLYLTGTNTRYNVTGAGPYLVYLRWWGSSSSVGASGMVSTYIRLMKNGAVVDTLEYYVASTTNAAFSFTVAMMANCVAGDYLELSLQPSAAWTSNANNAHTKVAVTFFLM